MTRFLDKLFADPGTYQDPLPGLSATGGEIRREIDLCDVQLARIARKHRKSREDLAAREAYERRKMALLLRVPR